jgi:hypothetical protein
MAPINAIKPIAGNTAEGAFPKAATPVAGKKWVKEDVCKGLYFSRFSVARGKHTCR